MIDWTVVVPVRGGAGKSRLEVPGVDRGPLARAIGWDTIAAVRACAAVGRVVVVTSDAPLLDDLPAGCEPIADPGAGLNAAVSAGLAVADPAAARAALLGDLPALRPDELATVLAAALTCEAGALPDADSTGTALLTRTAPGELVPSFGAGSFARHLAQGFLDLRERLGTREESAVATVRRDVDTLAHLQVASRLGLGARTSALVAAADAGVRGAQGAQGATSSVA